MVDRMAFESRQRIHVPEPKWRVRISMVEQIASRRLNEGASTSNAEAKACRVHS